MKLNLIVKLAVVSAFCLPALTHASSRLPSAETSLETVICGHIYDQVSSGGHYGQRDPETNEGTGYVVDIDCNLDQAISSGEPRAVIQSIIPQQKGAITKFKQNAVNEAAELNLPNARSKNAYACMNVELDSNPCMTGARSAKILKLGRMSATKKTLDQWINKARESAQNSKE